MNNRVLVFVCVTCSSLRCVAVAWLVSIMMGLDVASVCWFCEGLKGGWYSDHEAAERDVSVGAQAIKTL